MSQLHHVVVFGIKFVCAAQLLSRVWHFTTLCTLAHQAPLSMEFFRQEYWKGLPFPSPADWTCISCVSCIGRWILYPWATGETIMRINKSKKWACSFLPISTLLQIKMKLKILYTEVLIFSSYPLGYTPWIHTPYFGDHWPREILTHRLQKINTRIFIEATIFSNEKIGSNLSVH